MIAKNPFSNIVATALFSAVLAGCTTSQNTACNPSTTDAVCTTTNDVSTATSEECTDNVSTNALGFISTDDVKGLVFFDTETTGLNSHTNRILEITMYSEEGWLNTLVNIDQPVPQFITEVTGITTEMLKGKPKFAEIAPEIYKRMNGRVAVAHNAKFDMRFVKAELARAGFDVTNSWEAICTLETERALRNGVRKNNTLTECIKRRGIIPDNAHRSEDDVRSLIELYKCQKREGAEFVRNVY